MLPFKIQFPTKLETPIILSVPHCGTAFPDELKNEYKPELRNAPDDTDWFVDKLYDFCFEIGITMISATYSRWVIDLNRDPQSKPLYADGRIITALCPTTTFFGNSIYVDERHEVEPEEVRRRVERYYQPYHAKLAELMEEKKKKFGTVLLWDCHSIRQSVPTIHAEKFPDLILGDADGTSASREIIDTALASLNSGKYSVSHNHPFKGGYITRHFGKPSQGVNVLQLEMSKVMYMNDAEEKYDEDRAADMRQMLRKVLRSLMETLNASSRRN
jgi:N-formylglutamate deformylase